MNKKIKIFFLFFFLFIIGFSLWKIPEVKCYIKDDSLSYSRENPLFALSGYEWGGKYDVHDTLYNYNTTIDTFELNIYAIQSNWFCQDTGLYVQYAYIIKNTSLSYITYIETAHTFNFNFTYSTSNPVVFNYVNDTEVNWGNFTNDITIVVNIEAFNYTPFVRCYMSITLFYSYIAFEYIELPLLNNLLSMVPLFSIMFIIPLVLYKMYKSHGFSIGLILSTIILFMSSMIELSAFILLLLCELTIVYLLFKQKSGVE